MNHFEEITLLKAALKIALAKLQRRELENENMRRALIATLTHLKLDDILENLIEQS